MIMIMKVLHVWLKNCDHFFDFLSCGSCSTFSLQPFRFFLRLQLISISGPLFSMVSGFRKIVICIFVFFIALAAHPVLSLSIFFLCLCVLPQWFCRLPEDVRLQHSKWIAHRSLGCFSRIPNWEKEGRDDQNKYFRYHCYGSETREGLRKKKRNEKKEWVVSQQSYHHHEQKDHDDKDCDSRRSQSIWLWNEIPESIIRDMGWERDSKDCLNDAHESLFLFTDHLLMP